VYSSKQYQECNYNLQLKAIPGEISYCNKGNFGKHGFQYDLEKGSEGASNSLAGEVF